MTVEEDSFYFQSRGLCGLFAAEIDEPWDGPQISILDSPTLRPSCFTQLEEDDHEPSELQFITDEHTKHLEKTEEAKVVKHMGRRRRCQTKFQYTQFHCTGVNSLCETSGEDSSAEFQSKRFPGDLYTPTWIRGRGNSREGLCSLCVPPVWFRMKQSAYWYHMNFFHGISAVTGLPYPMPASYREILVDEQKLEDSEDEEYTTTVKTTKLEALCGRCGKHVYIGSRQLLYFCPSEPPTNPSSIHHLLWYKHSQKCLNKPQGKATAEDVLIGWLNAVKGFLNKSNNETDVELAARFLTPIIARSNASDRKKLLQYLDYSKSDFNLSKNLDNKMYLLGTSNNATNGKIKGKKKLKFLDRIIPEPVLGDPVFKKLDLPFKQPHPCGTNMSLDEISHNAVKAFILGMTELNRTNGELYKILMQLINDDKVATKEKAQRLLSLVTAANAPLPSTEKKIVTMLLSPLIARAAFEDLIYLSHLLGSGRDDDALLSVLQHIKSYFICNNNKMDRNLNGSRQISKFVRELVFVGESQSDESEPSLNDNVNSEKIVSHSGGEPVPRKFASFMKPVRHPRLLHVPSTQKPVNKAKEYDPLLSASKKEEPMHNKHHNPDDKLEEQEEEKPRHPDNDDFLNDLEKEPWLAEYF